MRAIVMEISSDMAPAVLIEISIARLPRARLGEGWLIDQVNPQEFTSIINMFSLAEAAYSVDEPMVDTMQSANDGSPNHMEKSIS